MEARLVESDDPKIFVHAWTPSASANPPASFIPMTYARRMSKGLKVRRTGHGQKEIAFYGYSLGHPTSILIQGDLDHADMRLIAVYALEFEDMMNRWIGGKPQSIPYTIKFFKKPLEYRLTAQKAGAANAMSYYDPRKRDIVMWFDKSITYDNLQALLAHELAHAYMDLVFDCISPLWFAEGMAEYAQHFTWKKDRADAGAVNKRDLMPLELQPPVPIEKFVKLNRDEFYGSDWAKLYAQAWTVVHFLASFSPDSIQELLRRRPVDVKGMDGVFQGHLAAMLKPS